MSEEKKSYIVNNISLPTNASYKEAFVIARKRLNRLGVNAGGAECSIFRRSVDARKKDNISFVYSVLVTGELSPLPKNAEGISELISSEPKIEYGTERSARPLVVGSGPAGLFAALMLAKNGYKPILIERGGRVKERQIATERFVRERILDTSTNIQFGAGGAGTFSDGKLVTRINDPFSSFVLRTLVEYGAPEEILFLAKPHIGTDVLAVVVENILNSISSYGAEVHYNTQLLGFKTNGGSISAAITNRGEIECGSVILAIGHSARDTYSYLLSLGLDIAAKDFSVGMRIEHPQSLIDEALYGKYAGSDLLGHAEYALAHNTHERGVYTFCMCPGGIVVPAASEEGGVVVNGMSYHARNGENANSAVLSTVFKEDYGATPQLAIEFQQNIERRAFCAAGSDYSAPIITVGDFLRGECKNEPTVVKPTYMSGGVKVKDPSTYLPAFVTDAIRGALPSFDRKIQGFAVSEAVLTGPETRSSAPIRIIRDTLTRATALYDNLYPTGEGAGYAGGITSASIDGIRSAMALMKRYKPIMHG